MSRPPASSGTLGRRIATVLRGGTLVAVAAVGVGFVLSLVAPEPDPGARPLVDLIAAGGPDAFTAAGMAALTLVPVAMLAVAAVSFLRSGERGPFLTTVAVAGMLLVSLAAAALFLPS
jgi:uncharacterized membrane protein